MTTSADVRNRVAIQPFSPFRIVTSSGQIYDVRHPEFITVGKRMVAVGVPSQEDDTEWDHLHMVSVMHITALEALAIQPK
jgi:hypothetical protein